MNDSAMSCAESLKTCFKCGIFKSRTEFYRHPRMADGLLGKCKECTKADVQANYREHIDQYKEYERGRGMATHRVEARARYESTPRGKMAIRRSSLSFIAHNPLKHAAHILVGNAIRGGRLQRHPCEVCGVEKAQAHHDDYGKPLDVRWLCTTHHAEWHKHNMPICPDQSQKRAA